MSDFYKDFADHEELCNIDVDSKCIFSVSIYDRWQKIVVKIPLNKK